MVPSLPFFSPHPSACFGGPSMSVHRDLPDSFGLLRSIPVYLIKYSPMDRHLGCFQFFPVVNSAAMNTFV